MPFAVRPMRQKLARTVTASTCFRSPSSRPPAASASNTCSAVGVPVGRSFCSAPRRPAMELTGLVLLAGLACAAGEPAGDAAGDEDDDDPSSLFPQEARATQRSSTKRD